MYNNIHLRMYGNKSRSQKNYLYSVLINIRSELLPELLYAQPLGI